MRALLELVLHGRCYPDLARRTPMGFFPAGSAVLVSLALPGFGAKAASLAMSETQCQLGPETRWLWRSRPV